MTKKIIKFLIIIGCIPLFIQSFYYYTKVNLLLQILGGYMITIPLLSIAQASGKGKSYFMIAIEMACIVCFFILAFSFLFGILAGI